MQMILSSHLYALNGLRPIAVSSESRSLGGVGVGRFLNFYEALYRNPALMSYSELEAGQQVVNFSMTYGQFSPQVRSMTGDDVSFKQPSNDTAGVFPNALGYGYKYSDDVSLALGVFGGGGGGDYSQEAAIYRAKSKTFAAGISSGISYRMNPNTSLGANITVSKVETRVSNARFSDGKIMTFGGSDVTLGYLLGVNHQISYDWHVGASFQPAQTAYLEKARDIDQDGELDDLLFTAVPLEAAVGLGYIRGRFKAYLDYRFLQWSKAEFLSSVGWNDQHVAAFGLDTRVYKNNRIRFGINQSSRLIENRVGEDGFDTVLVSNKRMLKLAGDAFVTTSALGLSKTHYTVGSSHQISQRFRIETAYVHMGQGALSRSGYYETPTRKQYGWQAQFKGRTFQVESTYVW